MSPKHYPTFRIAYTPALAKYLQVSNESAMLGKVTGRIDSTAPSDDYYVQLISSSVPPLDGAVTLLMAPVKLTHVNGVDSTFDLDFGPDFIKSKDGVYDVLSTTEFTKTIVTTDVLSCTAFHH